MKIFSEENIKNIDKYIIKNLPITPINLMEKAAKSCFNWINSNYNIKEKKFLILAGKGNNGGDGLAIGRMLLNNKAKKVKIYIANITHSYSQEFYLNLNRLKEMNVIINELSEGDTYCFNNTYILIDSLFGIGLNKPIEGFWENLIEYININIDNIISIDMPSGLFSDKPIQNNKGIIQANHTLSFYAPKLSFLLPYLYKYVGIWHILEFLPKNYLEEIFNLFKTTNYYVDNSLIKSIYKKRKKFSHKGTFGHGLIIGGDYGMIGSIILSAKGSLRSGIGKLSIHTPLFGHKIIQIAIPEAIILNNNWENFPNPNIANSIAIGPGLGKNSQNVNLLKNYLLKIKTPLVIDADAINILSVNPELISIVPKNTIFTPHPKEFNRLLGGCGWKNDYEKLEMLKHFANKNGFYIILKGAYTITVTPNGILYFNSTGNPGMATAGSGDVLTGVILSLLCQGYLHKEACILGVYLHGLSADIVVKKTSFEGLIAGDIAYNLGKAFKKIYK
ncbi:MAG: NAD(P)H-hydrate dehydratase [Candidatus Bostrichicola ureolyticus]|nr:MAG: NAD(P)H-hydrate dehydratase [Candidatus Bostrichicola ureolyticus]